MESLTRIINLNSDSADEHTVYIGRPSKWGNPYRAGIDGTKGIPGINAIDGLTYYLHIAYANSEDGLTDFDVVESEDKLFIGTLVDLIENDSTTSFWGFGKCPL